MNNENKRIIRGPPFEHPCPIGSIDPTSQSKMFPLKTMYMDTQVAVKLSMGEYPKRPQDVECFLKRVNDYFVEAASKIKPVFPSMALYFQCYKFWTLVIQMRLYLLSLLLLLVFPT